MTNAARQVLADCHLALEMLDEQEDLRRWRIQWFGALALLRAVGHVLDKVDARDPSLKPISKAAFSQWKKGEGSDQIFKEFIEDERNNVIKEYDFSTHPNEDVAVVAQYRLVNAVTGEERIHSEIFSLDENLFRPIVDRYGTGEDARDVYREALEWWDEQLSLIEKVWKAG